jgi:hypothetical protein
VAVFFVQHRIYSVFTKVFSAQHVKFLHSTCDVGVLCPVSAVAVHSIECSFCIHWDAGNDCQLTIILHSQMLFPAFHRFWQTEKAPLQQGLQA